MPLTAASQRGISVTALSLLCLLLSQAKGLLQCARSPQTATPKVQQQQQLADQFKQQFHKSGLPQVLLAAMNTVVAQLQAAATDSVAALLPTATMAASMPCGRSLSSTRSPHKIVFTGSSGGDSSSSWVDGPKPYRELLFLAEYLLRTFLRLANSQSVGSGLLVGPETVAAAVDLALAALQHIDWGIKQGLGDVRQLLLQPPLTTQQQQQRQQQQQQWVSWMGSLYQDLGSQAKMCWYMLACVHSIRVCLGAHRCAPA